MPRTASTTKDVANSFMTKSVALVMLIKERNEDLELVKETADRPESRTFITASRSVRLLGEQIEKMTNSLIGMHEKIVKDSEASVLEFISETGLNYFVDSADAPNAIAFAKAYKVSLDRDESEK